MNEPLVSVVISTYNEEKYILEAIDSILTQSYSNMEIIIVDDASTDRTVEIIRGINDPRIRLYENSVNRKLAHNLNFAISVAQGDYIARMDADDVSRKDRIKTQVSYMEKHQDIDVLASFAKTFGDSSITKKSPSSHSDIHATLLFTNPICHPTVMFRKRTMDYRYDENCAAGQDYELWARIVGSKKFHVLDRVLLNYRVIQRQRKAEYLQKQKHSALKAREYLYYQLFSREEEECWKMFLSLIDMDFYDFHGKSQQDMENLLKFADLMTARNEKNGVFEKAAFTDALANVLFQQWYLSLFATDVSVDVFMHSKFAGIIGKQDLLMQAKTWYKICKKKVSR